MPPRASTSGYDSRTQVHVGAESISHVSSTDYPGHYPDEDHTWDLKKFKKKLQVKVQRLSNRSIDFDLVGVDASIANAFRRILISEVPTVCIEQVYVFNNTSVIVDEVLAQRLGMIPLHVNPGMLQMRQKPEDPPTDRDTIVFTLNVECTQRDPPPSSPEPTPDESYVNHEILASDLVWVPQGEQAIVFADDPPSTMKGKEGIVLAKLRPGQEVAMECHAVLGVGKDHAKFSPVATASYRLLPQIILNPSHPIPPHLAEKFQKCFGPGVISVHPTTKKVDVVKKNLRKDPVTREVLRHPEFEGCVTLARQRDFFLFNIESESFYPPETLFPAAVGIMRSKLAVIKSAVEALLKDSEGGETREPEEDVLME